MIQLIPAVLATTEEQYKEDIAKLSKAESPRGNWVHIDFADNIFVQNKTIEPEVVSKIPADFQKEAHLMVAHPKQWVDKLVEAGFKRVIFHIESEDNTKECIDYIKNKGLAVGLAINPQTPVEKLGPFIGKIDVVLIMTIIPGFQGQSFISEPLSKVGAIKNGISQIKVGVDGAVKDSNAKEIADAGVDFIVVGSFLLEGDTDENLERLWEAIYG